MNKNDKIKKKSILERLDVMDVKQQCMYINLVLDNPNLIIWYLHADYIRHVICNLVVGKEEMFNVVY